MRSAPLLTRLNQTLNHPVRMYIANAVKAEASRAQVLAFVDTQGQQLWGMAGSRENTRQLMADFVSTYIAGVPDLLEAITRSAARHQVESIVAPYLKQAGSYFLTPPPLLARHLSLHNLFAEAYLVHRLCEELCDRVQATHQCRLAPFELTRINVIAHGVLGDTFAVQLDARVADDMRVLAAAEPSARTDTRVAIENCSLRLPHMLYH